MAELNPGKITPWLATFMIVAVGVGYFVFLYATWHEFQMQQAQRQSIMDEILDRLPKQAANAKPDDSD